MTDKIKSKAMQVIATYGTLRWCNSQVCGCMGCANHTMTKEEYDIAIQMPEIKVQLARHNKKLMGNGWFTIG